VGRGSGALAGGCFSGSLAPASPHSGWGGRVPGTEGVPSCSTPPRFEGRTASDRPPRASLGEVGRSHRSARHPDHAADHRPFRHDEGRPEGTARAGPAWGARRAGPDAALAPAVGDLPRGDPGAGVRAGDGSAGREVHHTGRAAEGHPRAGERPRAAGWRSPCPPLGEGPGCGAGCRAARQWGGLRSQVERNPFTLGDSPAPSKAEKLRDFVGKLGEVSARPAAG